MTGWNSLELLLAFGLRVLVQGSVGRFETEVGACRAKSIFAKGGAQFPRFSGRDYR